MWSVRPGVHAWVDVEAVAVWVRTASFGTLGFGVSSTRITRSAPAATVADEIERIGLYREG